MKTLTLNNSKLKVRLALTPKQQARGLMNTQAFGPNSLAEDEGMLFVYPREEILSFWMKNTPIPLSIAFIDKDKRIIQIEDLKPHDETSIKSKLPAKWALEVNQSWFVNNNIKVGDLVDIPSREIKIRILKMPPQVKQLAKTIEDKLVAATMQALKTKLGIDKLGDLNIDVEVK